MPLLACVAAAALAGAGACGKGVVPLPRVLFSFEADVRADALSADERARAVLSVLWTDPFQLRPDIPMPKRHADSTRLTADGAVRDRWKLDLHRPPPPEAMVEITAPSGTDSARLALAEIVLFDDKDLDGAFAVTGELGERAKIVGPDLFLAGATFVLTYVERPFKTHQEDFPLGNMQTVGYGATAVNCDGRLPPKPPAVATVSIRGPQYQFYLEPQRSEFLSEGRSCLRTHSP